MEATVHRNPQPFRYVFCDDIHFEVLESVPCDEKFFIPDILEILRAEDNYRITGERLRKRAKELDANLGIGHAEFLLKNPEVLSSRWKEFILLFPGTVLLHKLTHRKLIPYLQWDTKDWYPRMAPLDEEFGPFARFVCIRRS
jgi:hypothetical protein